jgi:hypothetical protein
MATSFWDHMNRDLRIKLTYSVEIQMILEQAKGSVMNAASQGLSI